MNRFFWFFPVSLITFSVSSFLVVQLGKSHSDQLPLPVEEQFAQDTTDRIPPPEIQYSFPESNCGAFDDDGPDFRPIIRSWLRGDRLENTPFCSNTLEKAVGWDPNKNVVPTYIDLNDDGKAELAVEWGCSATGNCTMEIFESSGRSYRQVFTDAHLTQTFGLRNEKRLGYHDIWTRTHGSYNSGDMVWYRFNGRQYRPFACFYYEYKDETAEEPDLESIPCSKKLGKG